MRKMKKVNAIKKFLPWNTRESGKIITNVERFAEKYNVPVARQKSKTKKGLAYANPYSPICKKLSLKKTVLIL